MFSKKLPDHRLLQFISLLLFAIIIKVFAAKASRVEIYFSNGFFPPFANFLRVMTGWVPFSIGDLLYFCAGAWLLFKGVRLFVTILKRRSRFRVSGKSLVKVLLIIMAVYIVFNIFWGLNYNRQGLNYQLQLNVNNYTDTDLINIQHLLILHVNDTKQILTRGAAVYPADRELFSRANKCYQQTRLQYPFMAYSNASVKSSLYGWWGNYLGFTGYYNPFSGEAQVNASVPKFVLPFTTCHEIAHQIGYAKEDEANFAGYLAATSSTDTLFHYSAYLELFLYANNELYFSDSALAKKAAAQLSAGVRSDIREWREFLISHRSIADDITTWAYGKYLKANEQPHGMQTYSEVIASLIAFYKKNGRI